MRANATTTPDIRAYIQASDKPVDELAKELGVSQTTIRRWRARTTVHNASRAPRRRAIGPSEVEIRLICQLRTQSKPSLDELIEVMRCCVNAELSRSAVYRSLQRSAVNRSRRLGDATADGTNQIDAGLVHVDLDHLPVRPRTDEPCPVPPNSNTAIADACPIPTDNDVTAGDRSNVDEDKPNTIGLASDDRCAAVTPTDSNSLTELSAPQVQHVGISAAEQPVARRPRPINSLGRYALVLWLVGAVAYGASTQTFLRAIDVFSQKGETVEVLDKKRVAAKPAIPRTKQTTGRAGPADESAVAIASLDAASHAALATTASAPAPTTVDAAAVAGGEWVEISGSGVNLRSGPSSATNVVTVQSLGIKLRVLSRNGGWTEVIDPKTGQKGWVFRRYIKPSGPPSDVQQTEPSTTGLTQQRTLF